MPVAGNRTIYLLCPANTRTGGPEAMHQLGRVLLDLGHAACMVYAAADSDFRWRDGIVEVPEIACPMPEEYAQYCVPRSAFICASPIMRLLT